MTKRNHKKTTKLDEVPAPVCVEYGYTIINDCLVPDSFLDRIEFDLAFSVINYGEVLSPRDLLGEETWLDFDDNEREVLAPCILLLIEDGRIELNFSSSHGPIADY